MPHLMVLGLSFFKSSQTVKTNLLHTSQEYAQIEKEALAITWACDRFADFLMDLEFHIQTDHKPLVPLFSTKQLDELPLRVQTFRMCLMRYQFTISHVFDYSRYPL